MPRILPTGTVTFLFTDIEGSIRLLTALGALYPELLARHHALMRTAIEGEGGVEVSMDGDAFFVAFADAAAGIPSAPPPSRPSRSAATKPSATPGR